MNSPIGKIPITPKTFRVISGIVKDGREGHPAGIVREFMGVPQMFVYSLENLGYTENHLLATVVGFNNDDKTQLGAVDVNRFGHSLAAKTARLIKATDKLLPSIDPLELDIHLPKGHIDWVSNERSIRVANLGLNIQKRLMFLLAVTSKDEFKEAFTQGHLNYKEFVTSQIQHIQNLIDEYDEHYAKTSMVSPRELADNFAIQMSNAFSLLSEHGVNELENAGYKGISSILNTDHNDNQQFVMGLLLHEATEGKIPTALWHKLASAKDTVGINIYEGHLVRLLTGLNPTLLPYYITGASDKSLNLFSNGDYSEVYPTDKVVSAG